jgi:hypothetical protein
MHPGRTVFSQLVSIIHPQQFARIAARFPPRRASRRLTAWEHFLAMAFSQVTFRESLRDLVLCLTARPGLQYHLGFRHPVARSTLADANEHRDWRLFAAVAESLMVRARNIYAGDPTGLEPIQRLYALDASIIDLSMALCPWANWTGRDAGVKLHTLLDLQGSIPAFVRVTTGETYETAIFPELPIEAGSYYLFDRGYQSFRWFHQLTRQGAFFVTRTKCNTPFRVCASRAVDATSGVRCDQLVRMTGKDSSRLYPDQLRRIRFRDSEQKLSLVFWTNQLDLPPLTIAQLYRRRWQVELFFKWIKYNLRIRKFLGVSMNAIRIQIWSALAVYLLVAIAKKHFQLPQTLHQILQVFSVSAFEQTPIPQLFAKQAADGPGFGVHKQLEFNGL